MREKVEIHTANKRKHLAARRDPYWGPQIRPNLHLGFRKTPNGSETWIARFKREDKTRTFKPLGRVDGLEHAEAVEAAIAWFKDLERGINSDGATVESVCREYVENRCKEVSEKNGHDAEMRFRRTVYGTPFGSTRLAKVQESQIRAWRNALVEKGASKATANRNLTALKAALYLAVRNRKVNASMEIEWSNVEAYKGAGKRRDVYLDLKQRRALLAKAEGGFRDLLDAALLTGARPGELVNALRKQFDARTGSMTFTGKTGTRTVPLSPAAQTLFERLAKSKLPLAHLLVRDDGKPWAHSDWDELVRDAAAKAELPPGVVLMTMRHSYITNAITSGMSILAVAKYVGTSVMMIEKHYGHLVDVSAQLERVVMT
jgi:integrase